MPLPTEPIIVRKKPEGTLKTSAVPRLVSASILRTLDNIDDYLFKCKECTDLNKENDLLEKNTLSIPPGGNVNAKIFIIGLSPGIIRGSFRNSFSEESIAFFQELFTNSEIAIDQIWFSNLVKCHLPNMREPTAQEKLNCRIFLERELEIIKPEIVIVLGIEVLQFFFPKTEKITDWIGKIISTDRFFIVSMYDPLFILHMKQVNEIKIYEQELLQCKEIIKSILRLLKKKKK